VRANYVEPVKDSQLIDTAIQGMVAGLDPHSGYMNAKAYNGDFQVTPHGQFGGIGVVVQQDNGAIKVISATDGMPAAKAGIKPEDHISAIDGVMLTGKDFNEQVDKMKGPVGTKVKAQIIEIDERGRFRLSRTSAERAQEGSDYREYQREYKRQRRRTEAGRREVRGFWLRTNYGITHDDYDRMFAEQGGVCAICGTSPPPGSFLSVDHDHKTGKVRKLLCNPCNQGLGAFGDDIDRMVAAVQYLREHAEDS